MKNFSKKKIVLVTRKSRLEELIKRFNTQSQARFYIEHLGGNFDEYIDEHKLYQNVIQKTLNILTSLERVHQLDRLYLPNYIFNPDDIVVVLGQDGLVANTIKYLDSQPVIGVNPDPSRWDGNLLPFKYSDLKELIPQLSNRRCSTKKITLAKASLNTGEEIYGVNDIFIGPKTHSSLRYNIKIGDQNENQSSSGIIISTGLGSTGWLKSLMVGADRIFQTINQEQGVAEKFIQSKYNNHSAQKKYQECQKYTFSWDSDYLYYTVREPFPSLYSQTNLVFGKITPNENLIINSFMPENGVIFSDGIEKDFINFNSGTIATIEIAKRKGCLVVR